MARTLSRSAYAAMFGPTTGDRLRLADTELVIEIEDDRTVYGEEVKFGGGKVIRDGMGQSQRSRAEGGVDTVITNTVILDRKGMVRLIDLGGEKSSAGAGPEPGTGRWARCFWRFTPGQCSRRDCWMMPTARMRRRHARWW